MGSAQDQMTTIDNVLAGKTAVPEIIDPVFAKTSPKRSFCMTENERFWLVFVKTGAINSGTGCGGINFSRKHLRSHSHSGWCLKA
jgi:hypothetical protein